MSEFVLTRAGWACDVCIDPAAPATAAAAAELLCKKLAAVCGVTPTLRTGAAAAGDICLGARSAACGADELRVTVADGVLWLDGGKRGIVYAVTALLEQLGYRFFAPDCQPVPAGPELTLPADFALCQTPVFEYRNSHWHGVTPAFAPLLRLNACSQGPLAEELGGDIHYAGFVHTLGDLAEMEKIDGEYTDRQPCLCDEKVFETVVKNLRKRLQEDPTAAIASVSQNDSHDWGRGCQCEKCRALDEAEGSDMGSLLHFVNRVAETLAPEFPDVAFDTLAYRYTRRAPAKAKSRENVIVRLCSIECCFSHPIAECNETIIPVDDEPFADTLRSWAAHSDRIYIWDYTTNFRNYNSLFPNFGVLRPNLKFFADNNVKGVFEQGNNQDINGEFGELRAYLLAKLLWDPYMSEETYSRHMDEFLAGYYGAGWQAIRRFIDRMQAAGSRSHFGIYYEDPTTLFTDPTQPMGLAGAEKFYADGRADFAQARTLADPAQRTRLERAEIQLDVYSWYLCRARRDALPQEDADGRAAMEKAMVDAADVIYAHVKAAGIRYMHESFASQPYTFDTKPVDPLRQPAFWGIHSDNEK